MRYATAIATPAAVDELRARLQGPVHVPGDDLYDEARATWNGRLDARPGAIAVANGAADVQAAVTIARDHGLPFAVQSTGHGTFVPADGGILVKTSRMAQVLVDPDRHIARVGPGARWRDVLRAASPFGVAPLCGSSPDVGVAGFTLGGGVGWLARRHGFAADSLARARVVNADGRLCTVSAEREPDLFWALRGAGANFGVATELELRLVPVARVYAGTAVYPIAQSGDLLARFRDTAAARPDDLNLTLTLHHDDQRVDGPVVAVRAVYLGDPDSGERALRPLLRGAGRPVAKEFRTVPFAQASSLGGTPPRHFQLHDDLPDAAIEQAIDAVTRPHAPATALEFRHWGGATARGGGPVGHRDVPFSITIDGPDQAAKALKPYATGGSFLNWLHDPERTHTAYTAGDYRRLTELKRRYDPDNVFGLTHNIAPAATGARAVG